MNKEGLSRFKRIGTELFERHEIFSKKKDAVSYAKKLKGQKSKAKVVAEISGYIVYRA
jgi:hypothetical protein